MQASFRANKVPDLGGLQEEQCDVPRRIELHESPFATIHKFVESLRRCRSTRVSYTGTRKVMTDLAGLR